MFPPPDKRDFCGSGVESLHQIQDVFSMLRGYNHDPVRLGDINLQSGGLNGQDVVEVSPACKT